MVERKLNTSEFILGRWDELDLHRCGFEWIVVAFPLIPDNCVGETGHCCSLVDTVQVGRVAGRVPPCTSELGSAVTTVGVLVYVACRKFHVSLNIHGITSCPRVSANRQTISIGSIGDAECRIARVGCQTGPIGEVYSKLELVSAGQTMKQLKSKPMFTSLISKAFDVFGIVAVEVNASVFSPLEDKIASSIGLHITVRCEGFYVWQMNAVDSISENSLVGRTNSGDVGNDSRLE